jgi:polyadenylation factor subunit 2
VKSPPVTITPSSLLLAQVFDVRTQRELGSYRGHTREVTACAWHPQHEDLFSSGSFDGSLMHWLVGRAEAQLHVPMAHEREVRPSPIVAGKRL